MGIHKMGCIKFGKYAEMDEIPLSNGGIRRVFYFPDTGETYHEGYRDFGNWVDAWWG